MSKYTIIIRGPLGCGKSTIARNLSKILNAEYFSIDEILDKYGLANEQEEGYTSQNSFLKANKIIIKKIKVLLAKDILAVIDGNIYWKSQIEDLVHKIPCQKYIFTLKVPLEVCINRDKNRNKTYGIEAVKAVYKKSTEFDYGINIDATKSIGEIIKEIISNLPNEH